LHVKCDGPSYFGGLEEQQFFIVSRIPDCASALTKTFIGQAWFRLPGSRFALHSNG
jgi:hypothetical protein